MLRTVKEEGEECSNQERSSRRGRRHRAHSLSSHPVQRQRQCQCNQMIKQRRGRTGQAVVQQWNNSEGQQQLGIKRRMERSARRGNGCA